MSLIVCPDCQAQVSSHAPTCPHCGCRIPSNALANISGFGIFFGLCLMPFGLPWLGIGLLLTIISILIHVAVRINH